MPKERLLGNSYKQNLNVSNILPLNKTENTYRLFNSDYQNWQTVKLVKKSVAVGVLDT